MDETTAWMPWEIIQMNQYETLKVWHAKSPEEALVMLPKVRQAMLDGIIEPVLYGGIDIGRIRDNTEAVFVGREPGEDPLFPMRFQISLNRVPFEDQKHLMKKVLKVLNIRKCGVDRTGLGMDMAENLEKATKKAIGIDFNNKNKEELAIAIRLEAEKGNTPIPLDRDLAYQIHSIKRSFTASGLTKFDTERNQKHHGDRFWGWAMAVFFASKAISTSFWEEVGEVDEYESRWN
jgi:phage FluMu gp28-like protein